jgi:hypothetical protein
MKQHLRKVAAAAVASVTIGFLVACAPGPGGPPQPQANLGCWPTVFGGTVDIYQVGSATFAATHANQSCAGAPSLVQRIYRGAPSPLLDAICNGFNSGDVSYLSPLGQGIIPQQTFSSCGPVVD